MKSHRFKKGDRVVRVSDSGDIGFPPKLGKILVVENVKRWGVIHFIGEDVGCYPEDLISEELFNSPLYQALL